MFGGRPLGFQAPDGSFSLSLPKGWTVKAGGDECLFRTKKGIGTLRITAWRTTDEPGGLDAFLSRQEARLASLVPSERKVLATERINMKDKKGLFRISAFDERERPGISILYLIGGGTTGVLATYIVPASSFGTTAGNEADQIVRDAILRMTLR